MKHKSGWLWPVGVMATGFAGFAMLLRGCWHRKMSWPVRSRDHSYQVCLGCGVKRLFDENAFSAYGPYSYDYDYLIAWADSHRDESVREKAPVLLPEIAAVSDNADNHPMSDFSRPVEISATHLDVAGQQRTAS